MHLHNNPQQAEWDTRIIAEVPTHYSYPDIFDWADMATVIDVGAHIGAFTLWLKDGNPAVQIAAVEAEPENYELLSLNIQGLEGVTAYYGAGVGDNTPLMLARYREHDNSGSHTLTPLAEGENAYTGPRYNLHMILQAQGWDRVDAIKLDCEGSEYSILAHESLDVLKDARVIVGEYHDGPARFRDECIKRLASWFDVVHLDTLPMGHFCMVHKDYTLCG